MRQQPKTVARMAALGVGLMIFGTLTAVAQPRERMVDPQVRLETMMSHLTSELELSDDQAEKVRGILAEQIEKQGEIMEARRAGDREARRAMRTDMEKWRAETDTRMAEVLTEDQVKKYTKYMDKNRRAPRDGRGRRGRSGRRG